MRDSEVARKHFQRYPIIYLTFKDASRSSWPAMFGAIRKLCALHNSSNAGSHVTSYTIRRELDRGRERSLGSGTPQRMTLPQVT